MAAMRKISSPVKAHAREDGSLVVDSMKLEPGKEYLIEFVEPLEDDLGDFGLLVAMHSMSDWLESEEEDEVWNKLLAELS